MSGAHSWLDEHLETFVRPQLGEIPNVDQSYYWIAAFNAKVLIALVTVWNRAKFLAKGRTILLPGRDVYLFEVIARIQGDYPTTFRPDISSEVAPYVTEDYSDTLCLDTGYKGSIPKAMGIPNWVLVRYDFSGRKPEDVARYQVFPKASRGAYSGLSGSLEGCPKYWTRGSMAHAPYKKGSKVIQSISPSNFKYAAMLTIHVAQSVHKVRPLLQRSLPAGRFF